jgi:transposase
MFYGSFLIQTVDARPATTMPELAARLLEQHGVAAAPAMLSRFLCRCGFSYKKALMAAECARADVRMSAGSGQATASRACLRSRTG